MIPEPTAIWIEEKCVFKNEFYEKFQIEKEKTFDQIRWKFETLEFEEMQLDDLKLTLKKRKIPFQGEQANIHMIIDNEKIILGQ